MLFYRACLPLSRRTLNLAARTIRNHRREARSRWRRSDAAQQALLVLVHLRKGETFAEIGAGFGVGTTTALRYVRETTRLLADQAPGLEHGLRRIRKQGWDHVILDGTLIACDRLAADRPFYSGKHRHHGINTRVVADPTGDPVWVSGALPGAVHDTRAARVWRIGDRIAAAGLFGLGDQGYAGCSPAVLTPFEGRDKPEWKKEANRTHARLRSPGERAMAQLKNWRILRRLRCCPH
ncbi:transposase family protein, partial [Streptomonospora salina]